MIYRVSTTLEAMFEIDVFVRAETPEEAERLVEARPTDVYAGLHDRLDYLGSEVIKAEAVFLDDDQEESPDFDCADDA